MPASTIVTTDRPRTAILVDSFSLKPFGGGVTRLADINGDGKLEMIMLQTAGQLQSNALPDPYLKEKCGVEAADKMLHCLTALDLSGKVLWQDGTPWNHDYPFTCHGAGDMILIEDVDADGRLEVVVMNHARLRLLDAATGRTKAQTLLPFDNMVQISTAQFGDKREGRQIICSVNDHAYSPWDYANPTMVLNSDLTIYREPFAIPGAGHNVLPIDVDNDGRDELLIGYSLLDHDAKTVLWSLDMGKDYDYVEGHVDEIILSDYNNDGKLEIRYAGSENLYIADLQGNILHSVLAEHTQTSLAGPLGPGGSPRVIICEKDLGLRGLDMNGNLLWHRTDIIGYALANIRWRNEQGRPAQWGIFRPQIKKNMDRPKLFHRDQAMSHKLWPSFMDGDGNLHEALPWQEEYTLPDMHIRAPVSGDGGILYNVKVCDLDGDGLDEILVYNRDRLWKYKCPS